MEEYIPRLIVTIILLLLLAFTKLILNKIVTTYGRLMQKAEIRILKIKHIISVLLNITVIFVLGVLWGVHPKNLLFGLSSVFAAIGVAMFAQWSVLSNITSGIIIFFTAPYRIGDRIHIMDKDVPIVATIENIQSFYTYLRAEDDELIIIPNNLFLQKVIAIKKKQTHSSRGIKKAPKIPAE